jgi:hypothetical protein
MIGEGGFSEWALRENVKIRPSKTAERFDKVSKEFILNPKSIVSLFFTVTTC